MNTGIRMAIWVAALATSMSATAAETDQFYLRSEPIADSTEVLNAKFNQRLSNVIARYGHTHDESVILHKIFDNLGGYRMKDKYEAWVLESPTVIKREVAMGDSVYAGMPIWSTRVVPIFGLGVTLRVDDQLIGSDKLSHFISQGRKFYRRYLKYGSEDKAIERGVLTERAIFGSKMTGSFSNADLVANYEGYLFYKSLFEDDVVAGKPSILRWEGDRWVIQRPFDWADHVNEYWDEALNVNAYDRLLHERMEKKLVDLCPQYWENPAIYTIDDEQPLRDRYAHLGMQDTRDMRLGSICRPDLGGSADMVAANYLP